MLSIVRDMNQVLVLPPLVADGSGMHFTWIDWLVVFGYLALTTLVGHLMRGKQASIRDFFLAGRSLPWPAVCGSIIATEISGVTFIGVPSMIFALTGNWTYLQWAIGSVVARVIVGKIFVKFYYEREIYSPYDFMKIRLGEGVKRLATGLFFLGSILGQSVRVLVAALALDVVTPLSFGTCIWIIGIFAIAWTLMGGMQTVIWTDVMQFVLFVVGGTFALVWMLGMTPGGWEGMVNFAFDAKLAGNAVDGPNWGKFTLLDFTTDPRVEFTLWVAIIAVPFQNLYAFGVDQLSAQRMFCCRSEKDAGKAIIWSSVGQLVTVLMMLVGTALFVYYHVEGAHPIEAARFASDGNNVFPVWITSEIPVGLRGLILAGIFAAAISSLDSILAALSQTTLSLFVDTANQEVTDGNAARMLNWSRVLTVIWGIALSAFATVLNELRGDVDMVVLAFGMISYTTGPMLGMFVAAVLSKWRRISLAGLCVGVVLSVLTVTMYRMELWGVLMKRGSMSSEQVQALPTMRVVETVNWLVPVSAVTDGGKYTVKVPVNEIQFNGSEQLIGGDPGEQIATLVANGLTIEVIDDKNFKEWDLATSLTELSGEELLISGLGYRSKEGQVRLMVVGEKSIRSLASLEESGAELRVDASGKVGLVSTSPQPKIGFAWFYPITTLITVMCGVFFPSSTRRNT